MEMPGAHDEHGTTQGHRGHAAVFARRFWFALALTVPLIAVAPGVPFVPGGRILVVPGAGWIALALSTVLYLYCGWPFLTGFAAEVHRRRPGMMTLITVGISVAYLYSVATLLGAPGMPLFFELATLIDVMLLGHWVELRSVGEASSAVEALARLVPKTAHVRGADGAVTGVPTSRLVPGDVVEVRPGETVPADGEVLEGTSRADEALMTGESAPVRKAPGDGVIGGSLNGSGALAVTVTRTGADSFLAQVAALVGEAQAKRSRAQDLADRAAMWLTVIALGSGVATLAGWMLGGAALPEAVARAVTVVVVACPHALGLAIPLVVAVSTTHAARWGLLVKDRDAFERARLIDTVVFDKTGTLTSGRFGVSRVVAVSPASEAEVLATAGSVERWSEHPVAAAIIEAAGGQIAPAGDFEALPGRGVRGVVDGRAVRVLSLPALASEGVVAPPQVADLATEGVTAAAVVRDGDVIGGISLADAVRAESAGAVRRLREMGIQVVMLTGDSEAVAARVAGELGIDRAVAGVSPAGKTDTVRTLRSEGRRVAMVGDGVNDAPALAAADLGIAIGAGTDVARAAADVVLVRNDPAAVVTTLALARATYRKMQQNLAWAVGYNAVAIPLAAGALAAAGLTLDPAAGAALMSASTVIVALNARLLRAPRG